MNLFIPTARKPDAHYEQVLCSTCNVDGLGGIEGCPQCNGGGTIQRGTANYLASQRRQWMNDWRFGRGRVATG